SYVVVRRPYYGERFNYAFRTEEFLEQVGHRSPQEPLMKALDLREGGRSPTRSGSAHLPAVASNRPEVVLTGDEPVGVLPAATPIPNADQLVELARCAVNPTTNEDQILARRVLPTFGASVPLPEWASSRGEKAGSRRGGASRGTGSRSRGRGGDKTAKDPETGTARALCHFRAEMDEEV